MRIKSCPRVAAEASDRGGGGRQEAVPLVEAMVEALMRFHVSALISSWLHLGA